MSGTVQGGKPPSFRMHDPVATERTTTRDILLHRTGLAPHHVAMFSSLATRAPLLERLPHLQPSLDFRSGLCYTNAGVAVTRDLVEGLTGRSWEHVVSSRILEPLGMGESRFATEAGHGARTRDTGTCLDTQRCTA